MIGWRDIVSSWCFWKGDAKTKSLISGVSAANATLLLGWMSRVRVSFSSMCK